LAISPASFTSRILATNDSTATNIPRPALARDAALTTFRIDSSPATVVCAASNPHRRTLAVSIHSHATATAGLAAITTLVPTASALACSAYRPSVNRTARPPASTNAAFDPVNPQRYRTSGRWVTSIPSTPALFAAAIAACLFRWLKFIPSILPNYRPPYSLLSAS
jgi:hypothetical protein